MDHRQVVRTLSVLRVLIGVALLVAPGRAGRRWLGEPALDPRVKVAARGLGARDVALGIGTLRALDRGEPVKGWAQLAAVGDVTDAAGGVLGVRHLGLLRSALTVATAGGAAVLGLQAAANLDD